MPARDIFHEKVKNALIKDGWTITADPYTLPWGKETLYVDLAAEKIIAAEKGERKSRLKSKVLLDARKLRIWNKQSDSLFCIIW